MRPAGGRRADEARSFQKRAIGMSGTRRAATLSGQRLGVPFSVCRASPECGRRKDRIAVAQSEQILVSGHQMARTGCLQRSQHRLVVRVAKCRLRIEQWFDDVDLFRRRQTVTMFQAR